VKIGDLVKVKECELHAEQEGQCTCFFCNGNSNRVGLIISPAPMNAWMVMFDCGEFQIDKFDFARGDVEVISETR
jgi:hypothetical protein